jgi:nucleotide-binding universal stress UspA family protein
MIGRTMYVVPFITNTVGTFADNVTIEITDSLRVVLKIAAKARIGDVALRALGSNQTFTRTLHSAARGIIKHDFAACAQATATPPTTDPLRATERPAQLFQQILVAVDHSKQAGWAVDLAARLALAYKSRLTLLHVVFIPPLQPELAYIEPSDREDCFREAQQMLERVRATLPGDVNVQIMLREGDAASEICKAAKMLRADLIVMGTHGRGAIGRMILGSVANAIVRKSACPVLTVAHAPNGPDVACEASAQTACAAWQS